MPSCVHKRATIHSLNTPLLKKHSSSIQYFSSKSILISILLLNDLSKLFAQNSPGHTLCATSRHRCIQSVLRIMPASNNAKKQDTGHRSHIEHCIGRLFPIDFHLALDNLPFSFAGTWRGRRLPLDHIHQCGAESTAGTCSRGWWGWDRGPPGWMLVTFDSSK